MGGVVSTRIGHVDGGAFTGGEALKRAERDFRDESHWYALQTRSRHEKRVAAELSEKGVEVFLPLVRDVRRWSDRRKLVEMPLFSCYVFLRATLTPMTRASAVQVPGVLSFVGFNHTPSVIPSAQIENIQAVLAGKHACSAHEFLRVGQRVRIRGGSLNGIEGILVGRNGDRKLVVSIDLIQQAMAVVIEGYAIEPA